MKHSKTLLGQKIKKNNNWQSRYYRDVNLLISKKGAVFYAENLIDLVLIEPVITAQQP
ncbi:hypothetical protein MT390_16135 [Vibrio sp. 2-Bac 85]